MRKFLTWFFIVLAVFIVIIAIVIIFISSFFNTEPVVPAHGYLAMQMSGDLPEYKPPDAIEEYLQGSYLDLKKIRQSFKYAAVDKRISGVLLEIENVQVGMAKLHELRQLIGDFRQSGKKVLAVLNVALTRDYYLATACDSIFLQPEGALLLTGFRAEVSFYKDLLGKLGIEADFEEVGKYKNAPDIYTRSDMADAEREVLNSILDNRYADLLSTIAGSRNLPETDIKNMIDNITTFTPTLALRYKLIDGIKYSDQVREIFTSGRPGKVSKISAAEYANISPSSLGFGGGARLALIYCQGAIMEGEDGEDPIFGSTMGASRVIRNLKQAADSRSVKAIILRIDSPGGLATAADEIWHAIMEAKKEKPVVASISDVGASGGYYIAVAADTILVQSPTLIGSIGVYIGKFSLKELYEKIGVNVTTLQRGKNAGLLSLQNKFSDSERKAIRRIIESSYAGFVTKVADSRGKSYEEVDRLAQGRVWTGQQGLELGLADTLGGLDEAIRIAKKMAGIKAGARVQISVYPKSKSLLNQIFRFLTQTSQVMKNPLGELENYCQKLQTRPLYLLPYVISIN
jgi:protease-4